MDLHKAINRLAADMASEVIDGAHVWQLADDDRLLVVGADFGKVVDPEGLPLQLQQPGQLDAVLVESDQDAVPVFPLKHWGWPP